jgi:precorrin-2 dehydrogenase/sirohydrochlorin ferrochelatase
MTASFLVGLQVHGRRCVVIGSGGDAADRAHAFEAAGGDVVAVVPRATDAGLCVSDADLAGAFVVVCTVQDESLCEWLFTRATAASAGFLLCCVDQPRFSTFVHVASVRRGPLQIAVATDGAVPALAKAIRTAMDAQLGDELGRWVDELAAVRKRTPSHERAAVMRRALEGFEWSVTYGLPGGALAADAERGLRVKTVAGSTGHDGDGLPRG